MAFDQRRDLFVLNSTYSNIDFVLLMRIECHDRVWVDICCGMF